MADIASLNLEVKSDPVKQANLELRAMVPAASAAERAAQRWGLAVDTAGRSTDDFSKRVRRAIGDLEFERQQLTRSASARERYAALRRAGVSEASAEGRAIMASVTALQAQRAAAQASSEATTLSGTATRAAGAAYSALIGHLKMLVAGYVGVEAARRAWEIGLSAGDLGEQAEQVGVNTDQLQAYRLAAAQAGIQSEQMDTAITKLAKSMGSAADGNQEMIERFQQLGVNLLDARGELRPTADVLPEVARGILNIGSSSQRTAVLMDLFGRSGAKLTTVLKDIAEGNDAVVQSARDQNAIVSPASIAAWDEFGDKMTVVEQRWKTLVAEWGAKIALPAVEYLKGLLESTKQELEGIKSLWTWIQNNMSTKARDDVRAGLAPSQGDVQQLQDQLAAARQRQAQFRPGSTGFQLEQGGIDALEKRLAAGQEIAKRTETLVNQTIFEMDENAARRDVLPAVRPPLGAEGGGSKGVGNPVPKGQADAWMKLLQGGQKFIEQKKAETQALGLNGEEAARLTHRQELLAKATDANLRLGPAQIAQLEALAAAMAKAETGFQNAKFMDDAGKDASQFIANQQLEAQTLFMTAEAAAALRYEQEMLNKAANDNIQLTPQQVEQLRGLAGSMAAAEARTNKLKEAYDFARTTVTGFLTDIKSGLAEGQTLWDAFGNAALNALGKITDKLTQMVIDDLFTRAFGGAKGSGGGGSWLTGDSGGGIGGFLSNAVSWFSGLFANGAAFQRGNVVPFARGTVVDRPTVFPMARGAGLMGEAGPEGIMPLRRGPGGRLGVSTYGDGLAQAGRVDIYIHDATEMLNLTIDNRADVRIVKASPQIIKKATSKSREEVMPTFEQHKADREGEWRAA